MSDARSNYVNHAQSNMQHSMQTWKKNTHAVLQMYLQKIYVRIKEQHETDQRSRIPDSVLWSIYRSIANHISDHMQVTLGTTYTMQSQKTNKHKIRRSREAKNLEFRTGRQQNSHKKQGQELKIPPCKIE